MLDFNDYLIGRHSKLNEEAPPGLEDWIIKNKSKFKEQYGSKWEELLYATAWKMHKDKK